jgi:hypothetical protein
VGEERRAHPDLDFDALADRISARLTAEDEDFARGRDLPADIAVRERDFTRQTLRGMVQYVDAEDGQRAARQRVSPA